MSTATATLIPGADGSVDLQPPATNHERSATASATHVDAAHAPDVPPGPVPRSAGTRAAVPGHARPNQHWRLWSWRGIAFSGFPSRRSPGHAWHAATEAIFSATQSKLQPGCDAQSTRRAGSAATAAASGDEELGRCSAAVQVQPRTCGFPRTSTTWRSSFPERSKRPTTGPAAPASETSLDGGAESAAAAPSRPATHGCSAGSSAAAAAAAAAGPRSRSGANPWSGTVVAARVWRFPGSALSERWFGGAHGGVSVHPSCRHIWTWPRGHLSAIGLASAH